MEREDERRHRRWCDYLCRERGTESRGRHWLYRYFVANRSGDREDRDPRVKRFRESMTPGYSHLPLTTVMLDHRRPLGAAGSVRVLGNAHVFSVRRSIRRLYASGRTPLNWQLRGL